MKKIKKAIIPAAGLGTRFLPATKAQPKEMLSLIDKPIIQYIVEAFPTNPDIHLTWSGNKTINSMFQEVLNNIEKNR